MGKDFAEKSPGARCIFEEADRILGYSLSNLCFQGTLEDMTPCAVCQPAIFTVSMAMVAAARERGASQPVICGGLSLGEFSAACASGVFDFREGLRLVAERGRLMDLCCRQVAGGMAAVLGGEPEKVQEICQDCGIDVANYNCPGQLVVSGEKKLLEKALSLLSAVAVRVVPLSVAGAYHSRLMQPAAEAFGEVLEKAELASPSLLFVQNVPGDLVSDPAQIRENLRLQVSSSVRWEACARRMMAEASSLCEFGPGKVLSGFVRRIDRGISAAPYSLEG